jgi:hypothetical protein
MLKNCMAALGKLAQALTKHCYSIECHEGLLDFEGELSSTWHEFQKLTDDEWGQLRSGFDYSGAMALLIYSMRMSMLAVRCQHERLLDNAAMALVVDNHPVDDGLTQSFATL